MALLLALLAPSAANEATAGGIGPVADLIDDLLEVLEEIEEELADAHAEIGTNLGPLADPGLTRVSDALDRAEAKIEQVLDPSVAPSLETNAGTADTSSSPSDLPGHAAETLSLIEDALGEMTFGSPPDHALIDARLRTIEHLLPGYRSKL